MTAEGHNDELLRTALGASKKNRPQIERSHVCACYHCGSTFPPSAITEWAGSDRQPRRQTACCPECGAEAVIGSEGGFPMTSEFLEELKIHWFFDGK